MGKATKVIIPIDRTPAPERHVAVVRRPIRVCSTCPDPGLCQAEGACFR